MGCGSSMDTNGISEDNARWQQHGADPVQIVQEFVRLDEKIGKLEGTCPGPRMATAEAWIEHLQTKLNALLGLEGGTENAFAAQQQINRQSILSPQQQLQQQQLQQQQQQQGNDEISSVHGYEAAAGALPPGAVFVIQQQQQQQQLQQYQQQNGGAALPLGNGLGVELLPMPPPPRLPNGIAANTPTKDLANLAYNLGVVESEHKASTHEDFFANLSESALYLTTIRFYTELLEHTKVRLKTLMESYAELNELYVNHDGIIALISGGTYMSRLEESLDAQLETTRDIRDKLGSTLEQWRICGTLLRASANSATLCLQQWRQLANIVDPQHKIESALECRNTLQASLTSLDCAQLALPHVEIKYVSQRQVLAVKHCSTYLITDIASRARYEHTSKVFAAYESNMAKASTWLYETFNKSLRGDFDKAEENVRKLAKNLRDHREEIFTAARK